MALINKLNNMEYNVISKFTTLALAYMGFMSSVGNVPSEQTYEILLPTYFADNVTKVENGKLIVSGHAELLKQLKQAREYAFPWKMEVFDLLTDEKNSASIIRFTWHSEKVGLFTTMAILKFDKNDKIIEINEVYNQYADITH